MCNEQNGTFGTPGTVIFSLGKELTGGSKKTSEFAVKLNKPCLHAHSCQEDVAQALRDFVSDNEILTLNVAGPRARNLVSRNL
jgi:putative molybdenum carrier protein